MTDFADLGIRADTRDLREAQGELRSLTATGAQTERAVNASTDRITAGWRRMASIAGTVAGTIAAAFSVRAIVGAADTWTDLTARVQLATRGQADAAGVMGRLSDMARRTYSSLGMTAEGWLSNATALRELGMTIDQTLDFQEAMNNALVVSGARGERAASVQRSLSQAMALGELRGDQLNTVIQNGGRVAELLAEELGVTVNQLRTVGQQGQITGDVIQRALIGRLEDLRAEADSMPATIGDAFTLLGNSFLVLVAAFDSATSGSSTFASAIISLADMVGIFAAGVQAASEFVGGFQGYIIAAALAVTAYYIPAIVTAVFQTGLWFASLITLRGALLATGIGAFIVGAGFVINALIQARERTGSWGEALALLGEVGREVWRGMAQSAQGIPLVLRGVWSQVEQGFHTLVSSLASMWADFLGMISGSIGGIETPFGNIDFAEILGLSEGIESARNFSTQQGGRAQMAEWRGDTFTRLGAEQMAAGFDTAREALARLREMMAEAGGETTDTAEALAAINEALGETPAAAGGAAAGVAEVGEAASAAQSRMEAMAGNMSRFFMQIVRGGDAARNAISQLLDRAAEMLMNQAFMSLLGGFGGGKGGGGMFGSLLNLFFNANGGVYSSPSLSGYSGGVYTSPQVFGFANGGVPGRNVGVFAEAGPEAIMPLKRGRDGKLGVAASGGDGGGGQNVHVTVGIDKNGNLEAFVDRRAGSMVERARGGIVQQSVQATYAASREVAIR